MKKLIYRNFINDFLKFFLTALIILSLIVWTLQAVNYFDYVTEDGHGLKVYFSFSLFNLPKIIHRILPFVFFISLYFSIIKFEDENELSIFWINGISKLKFLNVIMLLSTIIMIFQIFLGSYLSPNFQLKGRNVLKNSNVDFFTNLIREGKFINAVKGLTIFSEKKNSNNFSNIFIYDTSKQYTRMIYAKYGEIETGTKIKKFLLFNGEVTNIDGNRINTFEFDVINFNLLDFVSNTIIQPKIQEIGSIYIFQCVFNIKIKNEFLKCDKNNIEEMRQELLKRFYKPIYLPLITIICCLLLFFNKYSINYERKKIYIFLLIFSTIFISETTLKISSKSDLNLISYFLTPLILILISYILILKKMSNA